MNQKGSTEVEVKAGRSGGGGGESEGDGAAALKLWPCRPGCDNVEVVVNTYCTVYVEELVRWESFSTTY